MKILAVLLALAFSVSAHAEATQQQKVKMAAMNKWWKSDKGQKEAYFLVNRGVVCGTEKKIKTLHNNAMQNNGAIDATWIRNSGCRTLQSWTIGRPLKVTGAGIKVEYIVPHTGIPVEGWVHAGHAELLSEYKKRLR